MTEPDDHHDERYYRRRYTPLSERAVAEGHPSLPDLLFVDGRFGAVIGVERTYTVLLDDDLTVLLTQSAYEDALAAGRHERARLVRFFTHLYESSTPAPAHEK